MSSKKKKKKKKDSMSSQGTTIALIDSWADINCIQGVIPTKYLEKNIWKTTWG